MEILNNENWEETMAFIEKNIKRSGFVLGNIQLDYSQTFIHRVDNQIVALCNIYVERYCTYFISPDLNDQQVEEIVLKMQNYLHIGGTIIGDYAHIFKKYYSLPKNYSNEVAILENSNNQFTKDKNVRYLTVNDAEEYFKKVNLIHEFKAVQINDVLNMIKDSKVIGYYKNGELVAAANLAALSDLTGVVTGVFTIPSERGHGYARSALEYLLADFAKGRTISIFFSNPIAKKIYLDLGFKINENLIMFNEKLSDSNYNK